MRTASFCTERSGHYDFFDQGLSMFLPNGSFLQPPGHVHAMIGRSYRHHGLRTHVSRGSAPGDTTGGFLGESAAGGGRQGGALPVGPAESSQRRLERSAASGTLSAAARSAPAAPWQFATSSQMGDDGSVVVRFVNRELTPCNLTIRVSPRTATRPAPPPAGVGYARPVTAAERGVAAGFARVTQLSATDIQAENTPARPGLVAPRSWLVHMPPTGGVLTVPALSYTVVEL